jgi:putative tryptophan/tyrosine transport system substrate-binding protein
MKRREFITLLGGAAAGPSLLWPRPARAALASEASGQRGDSKVRAPDTRPETGSSARAQTRKPPTIGYLGGGGPVSHRAWIDPFVQRLREFGWIEGHTIAIEYRWGEGRPERYAAIAAEFVRLKVDVILAGGTEPAIAAKQATSVIPIIFPTAGDPVGSRLVASLARPGGNVTGLSNQGSDLPAKRLEFLREVLPRLRRLAVMVNADYSGGVIEGEQVDAAARTLGLELVPLPVRRAEDIASALDGLKGGVEALYTTGDPLMNAQRLRIITFALAARLPTMFSQQEYVAAGGLMSYGPNFPDLNRRAADYVDKVLRGTKPADLPVEQPTKFDLVINLITAKALGVAVPPPLLARADEVIE